MTVAASAYMLPSLWGGIAPSAAAWRARRQRTLDEIAEHVYGRTPPGGGIADVAVRSRRNDALGGEAVRIEADIVFGGPKGTVTATLLIYAPAGAGAVPTFLGFNSQGNHATTHEPDVIVSPQATSIAADHGRAAAARGSEAGRWPMLSILRRGYAVATLWFEELEVDLPGFAADGVRGMFDGAAAESWGAIGGWAWGLSRVLDALTSFEEVDETRVIAVGHSRLGKAALWATAQDERFAGVVSNQSGCGGASLFRHRGVEDIEVITTARPHWFTARFAQYRGRDERLPVDQHQLIALQAPRPTHVGSATEDAGADPYGEFLSTLHATPIFELFRYRGTLSTSTAPPGSDATPQLALSEPYPDVDSRVGGQLSYHVREGEHGMNDVDWRHILDFADATVLTARKSS